MGKIIGRFLLPHPPVAIPQIGGEDAKKLTATLEGFAAVGKKIAELKPQTIVILTPHGPCFSQDFYMPSQKRISGDLSAFGAKKILLGFDTDLELAKALSAKAALQGLSAVSIDEKELKYNGFSGDLDHGIIVPLYFMRRFYDQCKLLPISLSGLGAKDHYRLGVILRDCIRERDEDIVVIASGDLSHRLSPDAPYGFAPEGEVFDQTVKRLLGSEDSYAMLTLDPKLKEKAGQCGLDAYRILLGTLDGFDYLTEIHSYEAPFGVGYLTASLSQGKAKESVLTKYLAEEEEIFALRKEKESPPQSLARAAVAYFLKHGKEMAIPEKTPPFLTQAKGGVFVSIKNDGQLRGCIGTIAATQPTLAEEIIVNAVNAAAKDPRFAPIREEELKELYFSVDILSPLQDIEDKSDLDPKRYGIMVQNKGKYGVLLPDLEGIRTAEEQIAAARAKAGIHPWHSLKIKRFTVTRYE